MNVATSGTAVITQHTGGVANVKMLDVSSLAISGSGALDVTNNKFIVRSGSIGAISALVTSGLNLAGGGYWDGPGIRSSNAAADGTLATAVGAILNDFGGSPVTTSFYGATVGVTDVIGGYTWFGDADMDGLVTPTDYFLIDNGFASSLTGWLNGDFDGNGAIDPTDYFLIDNAFANGGGVTTLDVQGLNVQGVPEPGTLGLLGLGALSLLGRRRRK